MIFYRFRGQIRVELSGRSPSNSVPNSETWRGHSAGGSSSERDSHLISAAGLRVRQLPRHQLEEDDSVGVDVGLEAVRVVVLHADDLRSLRGTEQNRQLTTGTADSIRLGPKPDDY